VEQEHDLIFEPFRLDLTHGRLWRGHQLIALRRRSLAVLRYLAEHPGRLVPKTELRQQVWGDTHVTDTVLRVCVQEIRAALGDSAAAPRYLETMEPHGYRWLVAQELGGLPPVAAGPIVGRQPEVNRLEAWFLRAATGTRQLVFVSGDVGMGKTTVVDLWLARLAAGSKVRTGRGQCVEHYGAGEPYLPLLEALGHLARGPGGAEVLAVLRQYAPMWLAQLPGLVRETELERLQRELQGTTRGRMLRELADAIEVLATDTPLVLVLEDLHWSDRSTVECLSYVAQRRPPARLLMLGTYRPVEAVIREHPLRGLIQELCGRGQAAELRLEFLSPEDVSAYMAGRLAGAVAAPLGAFVHARTDGIALFMVHIVEHLVQQKLLVQQEGQWTLREGAGTTSLPTELEQLLVRRIEEVPSEMRQVLEAASVVGEAFAVAAVAAGAQRRVDEVEAVCEGLAGQHRFIEDTEVESWPDGSSGGRYRFQHALYAQVLYEHLGHARRRQLHRRIGTRLEAGYGAPAGEIAAQLAVHFERGGEADQAVHYWQQAADNAARRHAYPEAIAALRKGLTLLATLPEGPERTQRELTLQLTLGELLSVVRGRMAPEVGEAYTRAYALCQHEGETAWRFEALWGLTLFHCVEAQLRPASRFSQELFDLAQRQHDSVLWHRSHHALGLCAFAQGHFGAACAHLEEGIRLCDAPQPSPPIFHGVYDHKMRGLCYLAQVLWELGYADQAQQRSQEALAVAQQGESPPAVAQAQVFATMLCQWRRDAVATHAQAETLMTLADEQGFGLRCEQGRLLRGWALAMQGRPAEGVAQVRQAFAVYPNMEPGLYRAYFLGLLAEAYGQATQPEAGLRVLAEALTLVATTEVRWWEAELYRLQGVLLLQLPIPDVTQAEVCFQRALDVARGQQAKALELRAALSLSQLWQLRWSSARRALKHTLLSLRPQFCFPRLPLRNQPHRRQRGNGWCVSSRSSSNAQNSPRAPHARRTGTLCRMTRCHASDRNASAKSPAVNPNRPVTSKNSPSTPRWRRVGQNQAHSKVACPSVT
jgi:DNA-binding winged helix-turn-helix (wHTH) protein/predicted ATPase